MTELNSQNFRLICDLNFALDEHRDVTHLTLGWQINCMQIDFFQCVASGTPCKLLKNVCFFFVPKFTRTILLFGDGVIFTGDNGPTSTGKRINVLIWDASGDKLVIKSVKLIELIVDLLFWRAIWILWLAIAGITSSILMMNNWINCVSKFIKRHKANLDDSKMLWNRLAESTRCYWTHVQFER